MRERRLSFGIITQGVALGWDELPFQGVCLIRQKVRVRPLHDSRDQRLPERIAGGHGRNDLHGLLGYRVYEGDAARMQTDSTVRVGAFSAVLQISFDGAAHVCQLATNLMVAPCAEVDFEQIVAIRGGE